jgi:hypothetical protein
MSDAQTPRLRGRCGESVFVVGFVGARQVVSALCIGPYVVCSAVGCLPISGVGSNGSPDPAGWSTPRRGTGWHLRAFAAPRRAAEALLLSRSGPLARGSGNRPQRPLERQLQPPKAARARSHVLPVAESVGAQSWARRATTRGPAVWIVKALPLSTLTHRFTPRGLAWSRRRLARAHPLPFEPLELQPAPLAPRRGSLALLDQQASRS